MAKLAIKGHATRGKEVIKILEMLGGKNLHNYCADCDSFRFYIGKETNIIYFDYAKTWRKDEEIVFTLEEFLEKIPYKVGDKVLAFGNKWTIVDAVWDRSIDEVVYTIKSETSGYTTTKLSNQLQPYKEETTDKAVFDANAHCCDIMNHLIKEESMEELKIDIPAGYEFAGVDDDRQQVVFQKIRPEYPKTYEECIDLCSDVNIKIPELTGSYRKAYKIRDLLSIFSLLYFCANAYWKIAGEQLGLGKPWEPDWEDETEIYYTISYDGVNIKCYNNTDAYSKLAFPTKEMRDAFYENFKELIEECKELL